MLPPVPIKEPAWLREFKAFVTRGNVIDLAVGIVVGAAFTAIVTSLVEDLINPVIGLLIGGVDFSNVFVVLAGERRPSLEATRDGGAAVVAVGRFINAVIKFLIVAMAIFWLLKIINRFQRKEAEKPSEPTTTELLLTEIRDTLKDQRSLTPSVTPNVMPGVTPIAPPPRV